ncbi:MAG: hypothetical protein RBR45_11880 [Pseudomonas sp.]|nr:hypothetical protein [Pseudomonas sp.]
MESGKDSNKAVEHVFTLSYDGDSTKDHTMSADILGQSLISMASLITQADKLLNGEEAQPKVDVKANKEGSFEVEFVAWLSSGGIDVLKTIGISSMSATAFGASLLATLKRLSNRKVAHIVINHDDPSKSYIELEDNERVACTTEIAKLVQSHVVRTEVDNIFRKPILKDLTAVVKIGSDMEEDKVQIITHDDAVLLKAPPKKSLQEETISTEIKNVFFVQVNLEGRNGWKIKIQESKEFSVKMDDTNFIDRINLKKDFPVKGELFEVELETAILRADNKESTSYRITEVRRHRTTDRDKKIL